MEAGFLHRDLRLRIPEHFVLWKLVRARVQQTKAKVGNLWAKAGAQVAKDAAASKHRVERNNASKAARAKFQKAGPF